MAGSFRYDVLQRFRFIEIIARWEGKLNARHLVEQFGIGRQQASKDINVYLRDVAPDNLLYDASSKGYVPAPAFIPRLSSGDISEYVALTQSHHLADQHMTHLVLSSNAYQQLSPPIHPVRPEIVRPLLHACRYRKRVEVDYRSMSAPNKDGRIIVPHTLVHTGNRWHVRAFCEKNQDYRDFVLTRFFEEPDVLNVVPTPLPQDTRWDTLVTMRIVPDPRLSIEQQAVVTNDYGMVDGALLLPTRGALISYLLQMLHIDPHVIQADPRAQQIIIANLDEVKPWCF